MNDSRITAYALGELTGPDRDAFERELAASEDLQRELNETIHLADALGKLPMSTDTLSEKERAALREQCAKNLKTRKFPVARILIQLGAVAAVIAFLASLSLPAITSALVKGDPATMARLRAQRDQEIAEAAAAPLPEVEQEQLKYAAAATATPVPKIESPEVVAPAALEIKPVLVADAAKQAEMAQLTSQLAELRAQNQAFAGVEEKRGDAVLADKVAVTGVDGSLAKNKEANAFAAEWKLKDAQPAASARRAGVELEKAGATTASISSGQAAGGAVSKPATIAATSNIAGSSRGSVAGEELRSRGSAMSAPSADGDIPMQGRLFRSASVSEFNTEAYDAIQENVFLKAKENPLSTFSIDVDTASYANVRRFLQGDQVPPAGAIRTEELINYFTYAYPHPEGDAPFSVNLEVSHAPWDAKRELVRIGLKGREIPPSERGPANLVFLVDVSGSMDQPDKLPLLQRSLSALVENLAAKDRVAIVVYAGSSGQVLPSTPGTDKARILEALDRLKAGGSTNGGSGIKLAYNIAKENFLKEGNNRVILCTDGDFNVGTTSQSELVRLIEKQRASGVFLSVLSFGTGNLKDSMMEKLADKGNGNYAYIDSISEGRKVLVDQMGATLFTIAKDVKIQVEFNPARVAGYRLIGYENRLLAKEDFNDDKKDAGEIGAGHTVTALYEIIPAGERLPDEPSVDALKYQPVPPATEESPASLKATTELLTVKLRYKAPDGDKSKLIEVPLAAPEIPSFESASSDFQFAAAVAAFSMKLRGSPTAGDIGWQDIQKIVRRNLGEDPGSYRAEFLTLIEKAARLKPSGIGASEEE